MIEEWEPEDFNSDDNNNDGNHPIINLDSSAILLKFQILLLSSSQQITPNLSQALQILADQQLQLEIGQANDILHRL